MENISKNIFYLFLQPTSKNLLKTIYIGIIKIIQLDFFFLKDILCNPFVYILLKRIVYIHLLLIVQRMRQIFPRRKKTKQNKEG